MTFLLPPPQLLEIAGTGAAAFAHGQFSSDVQQLQPRHWQWSAWLSAQGRVRAAFRLLRIADDCFLAYLSGGTADALRSSLAPYVLRAKVTLRTIERRAAGSFDSDEVNTRLGAIPSGNSLVERDDGIGLAVPATSQRWCLLGDPGSVRDDPGAVSRWRITDIDAGLVELDDSQRDRFLPDALGLGRLGAVSVRKGCYPGQEIVARLHFKGGNKRWLHRLEYQSAVSPAAGLALTVADGTPTGELLNSAEIEPGHGVALAALPEQATGTILGAAGLAGSSFRVISAIAVANA